MTPHQRDDLGRVANRDTLVHFLQLISSGEGRSRVGISRITGMARSTVGIYVSALIDLGFVEEAGDQSAARGRPAAVLTLGARAPKVLIVELNLQHMRVAAYDFGQRRLGVAERSIGMEHGVKACVDAILTIVRDELKLGEHSGLAMAMASVPVPVNSRNGIVPNNAEASEWGGMVFSKALGSALGLPVVIENDANLAALGEAIVADGVPLIYAHLSRGIGVGTVSHQNELQVGADGIAGDVAHTRLPGVPTRPCRCGKENCVGGYANLEAIIRDVGIGDQDRDGLAGPAAIDELRRRYLAGDPKVQERIRDAGAAVGSLLAILVDFYNPATLVLGGELIALGDAVLSAVRSAVYENALAASTGRLVIRATSHGEVVLDGGAHRALKLLLASGEFLAQAERLPRAD